MLISFSVRNFRSIKDTVTLSFEAEKSKDLEGYYVIEPIPGLRILKLGLIYGANGSGKTTILKALAFLKSLVIEPLEKKTDNLNFKPFLFDEHTPGENTEFVLDFVQEGVKYRYEVEFNYDCIVKEKLYFYNPNKAIVYQRITIADKQLALIDFGNKIKINKHHKAILEANTLWNNTVLSGFLKTNFESYELAQVTTWFNSTLSGLVISNTNLMRTITLKLESGEIKKEHIIKLLSAADFKINDILIERLEGSREELGNQFLKAISNPERSSTLKVTGEQIEIMDTYFQHSVNQDGKNISYKLSYGEESQGTQRYYQFSGLLALMINTSGVFPIDELESSLHPDLLKHFLLMFLVNAKKSQVIATTHQRELLMDRDILRDDCIWFSEKKPDGSMDLYALSDFDSSIVRDTTSVYNAYKYGKLGAAPELGDYYLDFTDGEE